MTNTALDPRDGILQAHTPAIMMPRFGTLEKLAKAGHRYLVASDGIWLEVRRAWLYARQQIGYADIPMPFGQVDAVIQYAFKPDAVVAIQQRFIQDAERAFPNECGAWAVYDEKTGELDYRPLIAEEATVASLKYHRPKLLDHQHVALDLHSHGELGAGFSSTDDEDDAGEVKVAVVFGCINGDLEVRTRLCLLGAFIEPDEEVSREVRDAV